jgi:hypothetical protein
MDKSLQKSPQPRAWRWELAGILIALVLGILLWQLFTSGRRALEYTFNREGTVTSSVRDNPVGIPAAVVVDNHPAARPQSGLTSASLVWEAQTEGGITRLLAIFDADSEGGLQIGPVRSARPYFVIWAKETGAVFVHAGGSPEALSMLSAAESGVYDLSEFFAGSYFERVTFRPSPHNLYITSDAMRRYISDFKLTPLAAEGFLFQEEAAPSERKQDATRITIHFSSDDFTVSYEYDLTQNVYRRFLGSRPHLERGKSTQITPKNLVVQFAFHESIVGDPEDRIRIRTEGEGRALVFRDGGVIEGVWKKPAQDRTRFFDSEGNEIAFNRGQIFISVVDAARADVVQYQ